MAVSLSRTYWHSACVALQPRVHRGLHRLLRQRGHRQQLVLQLRQLQMKVNPRQIFLLRVFVRSQDALQSHKEPIFVLCIRADKFSANSAALFITPVSRSALIVRRSVAAERHAPIQPICPPSGSSRRLGSWTHPAILADSGPIRESHIRSSRRPASQLRTAASPPPAPPRKSGRTTPPRTAPSVLPTPETSAPAPDRD